MSRQLILIIDLEATCWHNQQTPDGYPQSVKTMEIIEFGAVIATTNGSVVDSKSVIAKPTLHPELSLFCQELTSISQRMVDNAPVYCDAVAEIDAWLSAYLSQLDAWGSWGNYDRRQIAAQSACTPCFMSLPHVNLKKVWKNTTGQRKHDALRSALDYHALSFNGQPHRGVDDALNIARLLPHVDWNYADCARTEPEASDQAHARTVRFDTIFEAVTDDPKEIRRLKTLSDKLIARRERRKRK